MDISVYKGMEIKEFHTNHTSLQQHFH